MLKRSRPQGNRSSENAEKLLEYGSELGCNPDEPRLELAADWSHLLLRLKEQSEVDRERRSEGVRS